MTHLTDRIAEFVFGELSASEMAEGQRHLAQCSDCRQQVENFQGTYAMLKTSPDADPPRRILFEFEKRQTPGWIWRWLAPMASSAAIALAIVTLTPRPQPQIIERAGKQEVAAATATPAPAPVAQQINYQQLIDDLRAELKARDAADTKEFQRVGGRMILLEAYQQSIDRDVAETKSAMQLLAAK
jgi:anti-sigma-K factor RskA